MSCKVCDNSDFLCAECREKAIQRNFDYYRAKIADLTEELAAAEQRGYERAKKEVQPLFITLREYLRYDSIDGAPIRQKFRQHLSEAIEEMK